MSDLKEGVWSCLSGCQILRSYTFPRWNSPGGKGDFECSIRHGTTDSESLPIFFFCHHIHIHAHPHKPAPLFTYPVPICLPPETHTPHLFKRLSSVFFPAACGRVLGVGSGPRGGRLHSGGHWGSGANMQGFTSC